MSDTEQLARLIGELVDGWTERIEYNTIRTNSEGHMSLEARAETVTQLPLLIQLQSNVDGYAPVSIGARLGKPTSRPPGTLDMLELVYAIDCYLKDQDAVGKNRPERLRNLVSKSIAYGEEWTRQVCRDMRRFIRTARIMLGYDQPKRALRDTTCGVCGGILVVAADASSDVLCVGTDDEPSCGQVYRKYQWVDLLDGELA